MSQEHEPNQGANVTAESTEELSEEQLDTVTGGMIIYGRPALEPKVKNIDVTSPLLGGPDTKVGSPTGGG